MMTAIGKRELFTLDGPEGILQGTYHRAHDENADCRAEFGGRRRLGLVFLNGLPATRAAHGNAAVYWADSFAELGYPCFRIDLPGFGDSAGDPPVEWLRFINLGGYAPVVDGAIRDLIARFDLSGVVLIGHCAGAVSAVYSAAMNKDCKGLVLIDPYFYSAQTERRKSRQQLSSWAERRRITRLLRDIFGRLKKTWLSLSKNSYPDHANVPLLQSWKEVAAAGVPILILKMPDRKASAARGSAGEFDYFEYVLGLAGRNGRVSAKSIEGANHTFSNRVGRAAVGLHTENWLNAYFPAAEKVSREKRSDRIAAERNHLTAEPAESVLN